MAVAMLMDHATDPKREITESVGDLSNVDLMFNQVLIGIYQRPNRTKGGIMLADKTLDEDLYQGKVGLVLKKGPTAFVDDGDAKFHGQNVNEGDWIVFRPSDGWQLILNGKACRVLQDVHVKARVSAPDVVY